MTNFLHLVFGQTNTAIVNYALLFMRVGIGILTFFHGLPKIMGGVPEWLKLGTFVNPLGIYFAPLMWGFLGALTESLGGLMFTVGLGTRIASIALTIMMFVAFAWHLHRGDSFNVYSFPLSLMIVYIAFIIMGSGPYSLDQYFTL